MNMIRNVKEINHYIEINTLIQTSIGGSSLTDEKDHHYFLNRPVCW